MFAVIYRGYVDSTREDEYQKLWHLVADFFVRHRGALGSCLHKVDDGMWLAYSRWPDKKTRDSAWPQDDATNVNFPEDIKQAILGIKDRLDSDRKLPEICMTVVDDLL